MNMQTLQDLFEHEIADLYSAETQLVEALPKLAQAATHDELKTAFQHHLDETRDHVRRLEEIRGQIGSSMNETCDGMKGLISENIPAPPDGERAGGGDRTRGTEDGNLLLYH